MPQDGAPANISLPASSHPLGPSECALPAMCDTAKELHTAVCRLSRTFVFSFSPALLMCSCFAGVSVLLAMLVMTAV